jgi:hypothetical protein
VGPLELDLPEAEVSRLAKQRPDHFLFSLLVLKVEVVCRHTLCDFKLPVRHQINVLHRLALSSQNLVSDALDLCEC